MAAFFTRLTTHNVKSQQGHVMKRRDCNFESMSTTELWDLYNELGSKLAARLQAEVTLLQQKLDEIQRVSSFGRHVAGGSANMPPRQKFRNPRPPMPNMVR
jgi:hypothetical protein